MDRTSEILAANIRRRRKSLGLTQAELGEALGYSEKAVSKWENGNGVPPTVLLPRLARCLETSPDGLLYEADSEICYLGIDGGGTKTEFALALSDGTVLRRAVKGTSNPNDVGFGTMQEVLRAGILEVAGEIPLSSISVFAGIAGGTTSDVAKRIRAFLDGFGFRCVANGSDAENAVAAGLGRSDGVAVILGTGSVAFAQVGGVLHRVGGYGYLLGDAGSGFAIGRDAILAALQSEDGSGEGTVLRESVRSMAGGETVLSQLGAFYKGGKSLIAQYAPLVFDAARRGDRVALEILDRNMREVSRTVVGAGKWITDGPVSVVFCGGLAAGEREEILPRIEKMLSRESQSYLLSVCDRPMVYGALLLAGMPEQQEKSKGDEIC